MSRAKKQGKLISCKLREQIHNELEEYCAKTFIAKTAVIEKALEEYLNKQKKEDRGNIDLDSYLGGK